MFGGCRECREGHFVFFESAALYSSVWERRISSWLPFAYLSHDKASHAAWAGLGPPPGRAWLFSCFNSSVWLPQWSPESSEGPQSPSSLSLSGTLSPTLPVPPSHPATTTTINHQAREISSTTDWAAKERGRSSKTKAKKKRRKEKKRKKNE